MGIAELENLAKCGVEGMAGAVSALHSELTAKAWRSEAEFLEQFPTASCSNGAILIPMGDGHCVGLVINYTTSMILIAFAGAAEPGFRRIRRQIA